MIQVGCLNLIITWHIDQWWLLCYQVFSREILKLGINVRKLLTCRYCSKTRFNPETVPKLVISTLWKWDPGFWLHHSKTCWRWVAHLKQNLTCIVTSIAAMLIGAEITATFFLGNVGTHSTICTLNICNIQYKRLTLQETMLATLQQYVFKHCLQCSMTVRMKPGTTDLIKKLD